MRDPWDGQELTDLLKADFRFPSRNHSANPLTTTDQAAFAQYLIGYAQTLIKFRR